MGTRRLRRARIASRLFFVGLGGVALSVLTASCQDPTQLTLAITTNAKCHDELGSTAIYVAGSLDGVHTKVLGSSPVARTSTCNGGDIGTLVVTPGNSEGAVVVIGGFYGKSATDCTDNHYENCIVARRSFTFIQHTPLTIPIELERDCLNVPCDVQSTCHNGQCYPATVACNENGTCGKPGDNATGPVDAGPNAYVDAPPSDATSGSSDGGMTGADSGDADAGPVAGGAVCIDGKSGGLVVSNCGATVCDGLDACCAPPGGGALTCTLTGGSCNAGTPIFCCDDKQCPAGMCCTGGGAKAVASGAAVFSNAMVNEAGVVVDDAGNPVDASPSSDASAACPVVPRANNTTPGTCQPM